MRYFNRAGWLDVEATEDPEVIEKLLANGYVEVTEDVSQIYQAKQKEIAAFDAHVAEVRESTKNKLLGLGLTEEEVRLIIGGVA